MASSVKGGMGPAGLAQPSLVFAMDDLSQEQDQDDQAAPQRAFLRAKFVSQTDALSQLPRLDLASKVQRSLAAFLGTGEAAVRLSADEAAAVLRQDGFAALVVTPGRGVFTPAATRRSAGTLNLGNATPYVVVPAPSGVAAEDVVVEPALREVLALGGEPAQHYARKLAALPELFVGTRAELRSRVGEMATAVALHFTLRGLETPLWRTRKVLMARWALAAPGSGAASPQAPPASEEGLDALVREAVAAAAAEQAQRGWGSDAGSAAPSRQGSGRARRFSGASVSSDSSAASEEEGLALVASPDSVLVRTPALSGKPAAAKPPAVPRVVYGFDIDVGL